MGRVREKRGLEERRVEERRIEERRLEERKGKSQKKEDTGARNVRHCIFPMICGSGAPFPDHFWKIRCRKTARRCGAKHIYKSKCAKHTMFPLLEVPMSKNCTPLWWEAHFQFKMLKTCRFWAPSRRSDAEKRWPGAKHMSTSKCTKHFSFGRLLEDQMRKNCTALRREAHEQVKMHKAHNVRTTFGRSDAEKIRAVVRQAHVKVQMYRPLLEDQMPKKCTPLWHEAHFQVR